MTATRIHENNLLKAVVVGSWLLLIIMTAAGSLFGSVQFAGGILAGGILALANYYWLFRIIRRALGLEAYQAARFAQLRYLLRFAIMALVMYLLVVHAGISVLGLILGLSLLVIVISALAIYMFVTKGD
jgi:hypothetical protein